MWLRPLRLIFAAAYRADPRRALTNMVLVPFGLLLSTLFGLWQKLAVDAALRHDRRGLVAAAVLFGASVALSAIIAGTSAKVRVELEERAALLLERELIDAATSAPYLELHERPDFQDRLELLRDNRRRLGQPVSAVCLLLGAVAPAAGTLTMLFAIHPVLTLMVVLVVPNIITSRRALVRGRRTEEASAPQQRQVRHIFDLLTSPGSAKEIRLTGANATLRARHKTVFEEATGAARRTQLRSDVEAAAVRALFGLGFTAAVVFLVHRILHGESSVGDLVLAFSVIRRTTADFALATNTTGQFAQQVETIRRLLWLKDFSATERAEAPNAALAPRHGTTGGISIRGLTFSYPGTDRRVLDDVSIDVPAGSVLALVGENGAGKSTLVKLLAALYRVDDGNVAVAGNNVRGVSPAEWQQQVAAVFQDFMTPHVTVRDAIAIGGDGASADDRLIADAIALAGASDLVDRLDSGLDTQLGPAFGGPELSRGEWQKLAIARAALRDAPPLLILDEPSASLDPLSESAVFDRFDSLVRRTRSSGGSTILVTHRLALVTSADVVAFMRDGRIIAVGPHSDLLARVPEYAELFQMQARGYL